MSHGSLLAAFRAGLVKGRTGRPGPRQVFMGVRGGRWADPEHKHHYEDAPPGPIDVDRAEQGRRVARALARVEDRIRRARVEHVAFIDPRGHVLAELSHDNPHEDDRVDIPGHIVEYARQHGSAIMTHNHTSPAALSDDDLEAAMLCDVAQVRTVWPDGTVVACNRPVGGWPPVEAAQYAEAARIAVEDGYAETRTAQLAVAHGIIREFNALCERDGIGLTFQHGPTVPPPPRRPARAQGQGARASRAGAAGAPGVVTEGAGVRGVPPDTQGHQVRGVGPGRPHGGARLTRPPSLLATFHAALTKGKGDRRPGSKYIRRILAPSGKYRYVYTNAARRRRHHVLDASDLAAPSVRLAHAAAFHRERIRSAKVERIVALGPAGELLYESPGEQHTVAMPAGVHRSVRARGDVTVLHNHTTPSCFSPNDLGTAADSNVAEEQLVWPDGSSMRAKRPRQGWPDARELRQVVHDCHDAADERFPHLTQVRYAFRLMAMINRACASRGWGVALEYERMATHSTRPGSVQAHVGSSASGIPHVARREGVRRDGPADGGGAQPGRHGLVAGVRSAPQGTGPALPRVPDPLTKGLTEPPSLLAVFHRGIALAQAQQALAKGAHQIPHAEPGSVVVQPPRTVRTPYPFQGFIDYQGLPINVENLRGSTRSGTAPDGTTWSTAMHHHYGEVDGTEGRDGDPVDVYVGPDAHSPLVVVVHQKDPDTHDPDEDKAMLGFATVEEAVAAYKRQYDRPGFYGGHTTMSIGRFKALATDPDRAGKILKGMTWQPTLRDVFRYGLTKGRKRETFYTPELGDDGAALVELPDDHGARVWAQQEGLAKGPVRKYVKRVPTGNPKRPWRYYYAVTAGKGVAHHEHFVEGARFKHGEGHYEVTASDADHVTIKHDVTGHTERMTKSELGRRLETHHAAAIAAHKERMAQPAAVRRQLTSEAREQKAAELAAKPGGGEPPAETDTGSRATDEAKAARRIEARAAAVTGAPKLLGEHPGDPDDPTPEDIARHDRDLTDAHAHHVRVAGQAKDSKERETHERAAAKIKAAISEHRQVFGRPPESSGKSSGPRQHSPDEYELSRKFPSREAAEAAHKDHVGRATKALAVMERTADSKPEQFAAAHREFEKHIADADRAKEAMAMYDAGREVHNEVGSPHDQAEFRKRRGELVKQYRTHAEAAAAHERLKAAGDEKGARDARFAMLAHQDRAIKRTESKPNNRGGHIHKGLLALTDPPEDPMTTPTRPRSLLAVFHEGLRKGTDPKLTADEALAWLGSLVRGRCHESKSAFEPFAYDVRTPFESDDDFIDRTVGDLMGKLSYDNAMVTAYRALGGEDGLREFVADIVATERDDGLPEGWLELPAAHGLEAWKALTVGGAITKGASHRYIKRVPTGNPDHPWRYYYAVQHGQGVAHEDHMVEGAAFRHGTGHYHVTQDHGDGRVTVRHDETGTTETLHKRELSARLSEHHKAAIAAAAARKGAKPYSKTDMDRRLANQAKRRGEPPSREGSHTAVFTSTAQGTAERAKARYVLMEADDVTPSHDHDTFKPHARYPAGIQERQYHRADGEKAKVRRNADSFQPELAQGASQTAMEGAPIVTQDGIVLGGNSRTMTMQHLYATGRGDKVRDYLHDKAHEFGLDPAAVKSMKAPILVRQLDNVHSKNASPEQLRGLVRQYNVTAANELDPRAEQVALAHQVDDKSLTVLDEMQPDESLNDYLSSARSRRFVDALYAAGVLTPKNADRYTMRGNSKKLNEDGRTLAARVLVGKMVPDAELLADVPASTMSNLARNAPAILAAKTRGHDLTPALHTALRAEADRVANDHKTLDDMLRQTDMLRGEHPIAKSPEARRLHGLITGPPLAGQRTFRSFAEWAAKNPAGQSSMFGAESTHDAFKRVAEAEAKGGKKAGAEQNDLFKGLRTPLVDLLQGPILLGDPSAKRSDYAGARPTTLLAVFRTAVWGN